MKKIKLKAMSFNNLAVAAFAASPREHIQWLRDHCGRLRNFIALLG
jgi:hypothetical protein